MSGWGAHLGAPLNTMVAVARAAQGLPPATVAVLNTAKGGATTASHRVEGLWDALLAQAHPDDVVVIQFGHNDQKCQELPPFGAYTENLTRFVAEARAVRAHAVLCTPVARRHFAGDHIEQTHREYPDAVRAAATALGVPLIDLTVWTTALYERLGPLGSTALFTHLPAGASQLYPDGVEDNTHFSFMGASTVAAYVAQCLTPVVLTAIAGYERREGRHPIHHGGSGR